MARLTGPILVTGGNGFVGTWLLRRLAASGYEAWSAVRRLGTTTIPRTRLDTSRFSEETAPNYLHRANREHEQILDAIARKDSDTARACMRMHLSNSRERLRKAIAAAGLDSTAAIEELNAASHTTS